jgi:hypothetical protein
VIRRLENIQPNALHSLYSPNDGNSAYTFNSADSAKCFQRRILLSASPAPGHRLSSSARPFWIGCGGFYSRHFAQWFRSWRLSATAKLPLPFNETGFRRTPNNSFLRYNNSYEFSGVTGGVAQSAPRTPPTRCHENRLLISAEPNKAVPQIPESTCGTLRTQAPHHGWLPCPRLSIDERILVSIRCSEPRVSPFYHDDAETF